MDSARLVEMLLRVKQNRLNLHSLLVIRNGYIVTEAYYHPNTPEQVHVMASVTKSVVGACLGIALEKGHLGGTEQKLLSFFEDRTIANRDANKEAITLAHLLSLTAGFDHDDFSASPDGIMEQSEDWVGFMLDRPMAAAPGSGFRYSSGSVHLLSAVLQRATGQSTRQLPTESCLLPWGSIRSPRAAGRATPRE
jgi:CubicO group peptidase (beta-lactamase class C family)